MPLYWTISSRSAAVAAEQRGQLATHRRMFRKKPLHWRRAKTKLTSELHQLGRTVGTSSRDVQKDRADEDHVALVDPLPGDRSPPYQPTSLPTPVKANVPNGPTKAELLPPAVAAMRKSVGSQTETTPLGATGRKRGRSGGCQLTKQKPLGGNSKAGPKLSPERMRTCPRQHRGISHQRPRSDEGRHFPQDA